MMKPQCYRVLVSATLALGLFMGGLAAASATIGLADSSSRLDVTAALSGTHNNGLRQLQVRLDIDPGWHVNANPASLDFLVPTVVEARIGGDPVPLEVDYPDGHGSGIELGGREVMVYDDGATITATLLPDANAAAPQAGMVEVVVQVQSCSDKGICLAPASIAAPVR